MSGHSHNPHGSFKHRSQYGGTIWNAENRYYTQSSNSRSGESVRTQLINLAENVCGKARHLDTMGSAGDR